MRSSCFAPLVLAIGLASPSSPPPKHAWPWSAEASQLASWPWLNRSLPIGARLDALVNAMNTTELISQLVKYSQRIERLGVPAYGWHMEAAHGAATGGVVSVFPCSLARAAAFDPAMEMLVARATAIEARAKWNEYWRHHGDTPPYTAEGLSLSPYAPEINLCRDPRWGRCQESRGEDPWLTARLAVPFVRGLQEPPPGYPLAALLTAAMLKDVFVYNIESDYAVGGHDGQYRLRYNAIVSAADLRQSFIPAFEAGIVEGKARSAMTSYHALNGIPTTAHPILEQELRQRLGWANGLLMSDGGAVTDMLNFDYLNLSMTDNVTAAAAAALMAGVDLNSGGFQHADNPPAAECTPPASCVRNMTGYAYEHLPAALEQGLVTVAALRRSARRVLRLRFELGLFDPPELSPYAALTQDADVDTDEHRALALLSAARGLVLLRNEPVAGSAEAVLPLDTASLRRLAVLGPNSNNSWAALSDYNGCGADQGRFINGAGVAWPCRLVTPLTGLQRAMESEGSHAEVQLVHAQGCAIDGAGQNETESIKDAAALAASADAAVLVLGLQSGDQNKQKLEGEAFDRAELGLPGNQLALVRAVLAVQPRTVLVIISGSFVSEPSIMAGKGAAPALIQQFYPGEEGGTALASALLGRTEFSGRLPITAVNSTSDLPPYLTQQLSYPPGRTHRYLERDALFPFGFGLTSSSVRYSGLSVSPTVVQLQQHQQQPQNLSVSVEVACEGSAASGLQSQEEVVQAYVAYNQTPEGRILHAQDREEGEASMPLHELRAFQRVKLLCGAASTTVRLTIAISDLALMDIAGQVAPLAGTYTLFVGGTSPRTPARLLRGDGTTGSAAHGAPLPPLRATFKLMSTTNFRT